MADDRMDLMNELLKAERSGVAVGALLQTTLPDGYLRNHVTKILNDEAVSCSVLEDGIRALGGEPEPGENDFAAKVEALPTLVERLELLARGQAWAVKRIDLLLAGELPEELRRALEEMRIEHVENINWCNEQAAAMREEEEVEV